jgi:hypothetical protein
MKKNNVKFTEEEINNIINDYNNGMCPKDLSIKYKRNSGTIIGKLLKLGIYKNNRMHFTNEDIDFLKIHYPVGDWDVIFNRFPNIKKQQIFNKMSSLNIKMDSFFWSEDEINLLKQYYSSCNSVSDLIEILNNKFTYGAITTKAEKLGLKTRDFWSDDEIYILKSNISNKTLDEMELLLPNRNSKTIAERAYELNVRNVTKFSVDQEQFIKNNWLSMNDEEMANCINKTKVGVIGKRLLLGLLRVKENSSYNDLSEYVRRNNIEWKNKSMKACNYKCSITGERFQAIHHVYGLNLILNETLDELGISIKNSMNDYTDIELRDILNTFRRNQDKYPLGICLRDDIHKLFHKIYGYGNNTYEQWKIFENDIKNNKYEIKNLKTA